VNVGDGRRRVAVDDHDVGLLADRERADPVVSPEVLGTVERADGDRFERRETGLDQELELALVRVTGDHAASTGRIGARDQEATGFDERALEDQRLRKQLRIDRLLILLRAVVVLQELLFELRHQHVESRRQRTARRERLEDGQRRRQRDFLVDQLLDERLERLTVLVERGNRLLTALLSGAHVGLLVGHEVRGGEETVFEVVDSQIRRFAVGNRAEVTGDLQPSLVRFLNRRAELVTADVHVGLERRRALVSPVVHLTPRVVGPFHVPHLREGIRSVQIGRRGIDGRSCFLPVVDEAFELQVHEAVYVAAGPHRRHAAGQIQADEALP